MDGYIIEKSVTKRKIISYEEKEGYSFSPKGEGYKNVKKITITDGALNEKILLKKIEKEYQRILKILYSIASSEDSTTTDVLMAFSEIKRLEDIIIYKYKKLLKREIIEKYLKKLKILEIELNKLSYNYEIQNTYEEEKGMKR